MSCPPACGTLLLVDGESTDVEAAAEHCGTHEPTEDEVVTPADVDEEALERVMALTGARTAKEAIDLALRDLADRHDRAARIGGRFRES
ncbi:type II toxin-antitoxin system VapB family antitoxin [Kitasatospora sp. NPDC051170]|uniref:type II toxin-antitoxin system VapB family antitoxin n=1 Tax=Kitasatospora sp. NPDC051170 TaxID=3364056 RepID=UPI00378E6D6E